METKPHILTADDEATARSLARKVLEDADFTVEETANGFLALKQPHAMEFHDQLTGLPNREGLNDLLLQAIAQARRNHKRVGVLMCNLDGFKFVNDSLGHHIGDGLLEAVAARFHGALRESDMQARLVGDTFAIALPELNSAEGAAIAARGMLRALIDPFYIEGHEMRIGASIGIGLYPDDGEEPAVLLRAADTAMYEAKDKGRGLCRFFTSALDGTAQTRIELTEDLRYALKRNQFVLHYQPQVALDSGLVIGVEALLRWNHPQRGLTSPAQFIPMLEETRAIVEVGKWVLQTACKQHAAWQQNGLRPIRMGVNLSAIQFHRDDIVKTVRSALLESGMSAEYLELEFPESLTLNDAETTLETIGNLKGLGVQLSVDDFGTGGSSLSYLRRFPLDRMKIDHSFMRDIASRSSDSAVVRSIIDLAENLGLACTAEGVETIEQIQYLQDHLCAEMQGYFFSRPLPEPEASALLRSAKTLLAK